MSIPNYKPPKPGAKIIIVGGGSFGLSTAHALSLKGNAYDIHVFDRERIPASDAASTGECSVTGFDNGRVRKINADICRRYQQDCAYGLW
jgi:sarcosine oxidase/L-pipecolate oxidase